MKRILIIVVLWGLAVHSRAGLIWSEDFTNITAWTIVSDPKGGSTITSDGVRGSLYVDGSDTLAAYTPNGALKPFVAFNQAQKSDYRLNLSIQDLTWSVSYDLSLDQFDASHNYLTTLWQVFPLEFTSTFVGTTNLALGDFNFDASCAYLMPKLTVHTGDGGQTVRINELSFDLQAVPEAGTTALCITGALLLLLRPLTRKLIWK